MTARSKLILLVILLLWLLRLEVWSFLLDTNAHFLLFSHVANVPNTRYDEQSCP